MELVLGLDILQIIEEHAWLQFFKKIWKNPGADTCRCHETNLSRKKNWRGG